MGLRCIAAVLPIGLALCASVRADTYYRWTDSDGSTRVTHDQPGTGVAYQAFEVPDPIRWSNAPSMPPEVASAGGTSIQGLFKIASQSVYGVMGKLRPGPDGRSARVYGSAVAITDKLAVTNCHVVEAARDEIYLGAASSDSVEQATLIAADYEADRCVIGVHSMDLKPVAGIRAFDSLEVGEAVYAIGNPLRLERTLSDGLLSAKRVIAERHYLQTTAAISPGSSGGGLFDVRGNLIGVTTFTIKGGQNINFAIPAEDFWR